MSYPYENGVRLRAIYNLARELSIETDSGMRQPDGTVIHFRRPLYLHDVLFMIKQVNEYKNLDLLKLLDEWNYRVASLDDQIEAVIYQVFSMLSVKFDSTLDHVK